MNKLMIIGCLGNDPTLRMLPDGTAVCSFNVAVSGKGQRQNNNMVSRYDLAAAG